MKEIVGVLLEYNKKIEYFNPNSLLLKKDDKVIVKDKDCYQIGIVVIVKKEYKDNLKSQTNKVVRKINKKDLNQYNQNLKDANNALQEAKKLAKELNLNMNIINCIYTFDRKQLYFIFVSESRVDFRELAKKLAQKYKTRIELRQIGVRDKAKQIGGIGPCGLFLCCNTFLNDFNSVSINMAKNQFLALNPNKINGVCGRLLCCLNYEDSQYIELKKELPSFGEVINTKDGSGKVVSVNIFKNSYKVELKNKGIVEYILKDGSN